MIKWAAFLATDFLRWGLTMVLLWFTMVLHDLLWFTYYAYKKHSVFATDLQATKLTLFSNSGISWPIDNQQWMGNEIHHVHVLLILAHVEYGGS